MHIAEASPAGGSGRSDPAFCVTGEGLDLPAEISLFPRRCVIRVFAISIARKQLKNIFFAMGFFRGHGPDLSTLLPHENPWRRLWYLGMGALDKFV